MKKLLAVVFVLFLTISLSAQEKKNLDGAITTLHLSAYQATELKSIANEKNEKIKEIKMLKLDKEVEGLKIRDLMKSIYSKTNVVLGKEKMKEWNAYWKKNN